MRSLLTAAILLAGTGCFHFHYVTDEEPSPWRAFHGLEHAVVFGMAVVAPLDVSEVCPGGFARVDAVETFANGLAATIALNMYTPQTMTVTCALRGSPALGPGPFWQGDTGATAKPEWGRCRQ